MASRTAPLTLPDLISAIGWRLLLAACLLAAIARTIGIDHFATAFALGAALALTCFDIWRLLPRPYAPPARAWSDEFDAARRLDHALALLDAVTVALFALDQDGRVGFANRAGRALAGFEIARLRDIPLLGEDGTATILSLPIGGRQLVSLTDGRSMLVWVGALAIPGSAPQRLVSMQAVAGELDAVQVVAWHRMTRVLAHEMMNSLTPIASISESLSRLTMDDGVRPEVAKGVATIARRGRHLLNFVERYRAIVDLPEPDRIRIDVAHFLSDMDQLVGEDLRQRGVDFATDPVAPGLQILADRALLEQALLNLVRNGADAVAARPAPRIRLSCVRAGGSVTLSVADNGVGVPEDQLEEIFVPFFTTKQDGGGIGLTLSRQIAAAHGGRLTARRIGDGGTGFDLLLPA